MGFFYDKNIEVCMSNSLPSIKDSLINVSKDNQKTNPQRYIGSVTYQENHSSTTCTIITLDGFKCVGLAMVDESFSHNHAKLRAYKAALSKVDVCINYYIHLLS